MKRYIFLFVILISCDPAQKAKNHLEYLNSFVTEVESGWKSYTDKDWISADSTINEYKSFFNNIELERLSEEERSEYNSLIGKYTGIKTGYKSRKFINNIKGEMTDLGNKAKGFTEGLIKTIDSSILK